MHAIPDRPCVKPWYRLARGSGSVVLEWAGKAIVLEGEATTRLLPALLPLLDGTRSVAEITEALGEPVEPAVRNALSLLARHGVLMEAFSERSSAVPHREAAFFAAATSQRGSTAEAAAEALSAARVAVAGDGPLAAELARALRLAGVGEVDRARLGDAVPAADLGLAAPSPPELPLLEEWNADALAAGVVWAPLLPFDGRLAAVGPVVVPGETCCYECYRLRRASNSGYFAEHRALEREPASYPVPGAVNAVSAGIATLVAVRWLVDRDPALPGILFALELAPAPALTAHHVYRVPRCPACSAIARVAPPLPWFERDEA